MQDASNEQPGNWRAAYVHESHKALTEQSMPTQQASRNTISFHGAAHIVPTHTDLKGFSLIIVPKALSNLGEAPKFQCFLV